MDTGIMHRSVCLCWQHEINQFAISSFVPFEQSHFNTPNLAGALAIVETGIAEDSDERTKQLQEMRHTSKKCEHYHVLLLFFCCYIED